MDEIEKIEGIFTKIIFKTTNYMVCVFECDHDEIVVTSPFFEIEKGTKYILSGNYVNHPKYGFQFNVICFEKLLPEAKEEIIRFLSGPIFKTIGLKTASKIYDYFQEDTLKVLNENVDRINEVNISLKQKNYIIEGFSLLKNKDTESIFSLITNGYTNNEAYKIFAKFKENTIQQLNDNPYKFYLDCYGVSFQKVNECSKNINIENKEFKYKEAFLVYLFKEYSFNLGDIYIDYEDLEKYYHKYYDDFSLVINTCIQDEYLINENNRIYLKETFDNEYYISNYLVNNNKKIELDKQFIDDAIGMLSINESIEYDEKQLEAIYHFFTNDFSIITGGPGTGKTTIIKAITKIYSTIYPYNSIIVIAPTGRSAKRINEICDIPSKTIHSLLRWNKEDNTFVFNEDNPILYDAVIIDEFSMVDSDLYASFLKACSKVKKICVIGDINQLPSIRQGNVLKDLIDTKYFCHTELSTIYRQKQGNEIINLANDIVNDNIDFNNYINDVKFIELEDFNVNDLISMINDDFKTGSDLDDIQVLVPMYRGNLGIDYLNQYLQESFNPKDKRLKEKRIGTVIYREGDKILQLKNRPDDDVYNGDIGFLEEINDQEKTFLINYNGVYIYYNYEDLNEISLAYAMSVHKSQGSEYKNIYFVFNSSQNIMLNKNLIYTAISRAKNKLVIIGNKELFIESCKKKIKDRKTTLKERILSYK